MEDKGGEHECDVISSTSTQKIGGEGKGEHCCVVSLDAGDGGGEGKGEGKGDCCLLLLCHRC